MLLGAPGIATRTKKLLGAPGRTTRSKDATIMNELRRCYQMHPNSPVAHSDFQEEGPDGFWKVNDIIGYMFLGKVSEK